MKRASVLFLAALALTACGSTAPKPTAGSGTPTPTPTVSASPDAFATGDPASPTPSSTSTTGPRSTAGTPTAPSAAAASATAVHAAPLRLGVVASDRTSFQSLLASRRALGGRTVAGVYVSSCAGLVGVDLALVQGEACAGTPFPVLAAGPALGAVTANLTSITSLTVDTRVRLVLTRALTPSTGPLGVVVEACPVNQQAVTKTLTPVAKQRGFTVAATASVPCGKAADAGRAVAALQAKKVEQVVFVSGAQEAVLVRAFTRVARARSFAPVYGVTSATVPATLTDQREKVVGIGWSPSIDTTAATSSVAINTCLRAVRKAGAALPSTPAQRFTTYGACDLLDLADRALTATRGSADPTAVRAAIRALKTSFPAASVLDSATDFRTRQTAPARVSAFAWYAGCTCVQYTGNRIAI